MEFIESGVPNLDFVLGGGLVAGSLTMVAGRPGCGKTILAHQIAFHAARQGRKVLVLTTLPEPHVKLLSNLRTLAFFDEGLLGERIELINVYRQLREDIANAGTAIVRLVRDARANLLILDSFDSVRGLARDEAVIRELVYELSAGLGLLGITVVIVSAFEPRQAGDHTELAVADQIVMLHSGLAGARGTRHLEITKMRGAAQRGGLHAYRIDATGLRVFPRQESVPLPPEAALREERVPFGLAELDAMLGGGPTPGSASLLVGNPGTGKTLLALQFLLAGARRLWRRAAARSRGSR
jgi:circadian clock protein KaiC